jgi:hypothetical protein
VGGISVDETFYDFVTNSYLVPDNAGKRNIVDGELFRNDFDAFNNKMDQIVAAGSTLWDWIYSSSGWDFSGVIQLIAELNIIIAALALEEGQSVATFCGDLQPSVDFEIPLPSVMRTWEFESATADVQADGLHYTIQLRNIGATYNFRTELSVGTSPLCVLDSNDEGFIVYDTGTYELIFRRTAQGTFHTEASMVSLGSIVEMIPGLGDDMGSFVASLARSIGFDNRLQAHATSLVPLELEALFDELVLPYLPGPNGIHDLTGQGQNTRYGMETIPGIVGDAVFQPMATPVLTDKLQRPFLRDHAGIDVPFQADCVSPNLTFPENVAVLPPFDSEAIGPMGIAYFDSVAWNHPSQAALQTEVGRRSQADMNSVLGVTYPGAKLQDLAPELIEDFTYTFTDLASPALPIPLSNQQINAIVGTIGAVQVGATTILVEVCSMETINMIHPMSAGPSGSGEVLQQMHLRAFITGGGIPMGSLKEDYTATYHSDLRLAKIQGKYPGPARFEFHVANTEMVGLETTQGGVPLHDWSDITTSTPIQEAPVSLLLRGLFGDSYGPANQADPRVRYLIEGLTLPLVAREVQGMIALPSLDFPAFAAGPVTAFAHPNGSVDVIGQNPGDVGLRIAVPPLCATVQRWGQVFGMIAGAPSMDDQMLAIEFDWTPWSPNVQITTSALVSDNGGGASGTSPGGVPVSATANPSRWDNGYMRVDYAPNAGDKTRVMFASGSFMGDMFEEGGAHFVVATAAGYQTIREAIGAGAITNASLELRPYHGFGWNVNCAALDPLPTAAPPNGRHHEAEPQKVFEALVFQSQFNCALNSDCADSRQIWVHTAPLLAHCPTAIDSDQGKVEVSEGTLRTPPDTYDYTPCSASGGGGGPGEGSHSGGVIID